MSLPWRLVGSGTYGGAVGRRESQLSGNNPQLLAFANDLRRLRQNAGSPSYRQLSKQVHYSPSALSQAANGRSMPSLGVTLGFVKACGGDVDEWEFRWRMLNADGSPDGEHANAPSVRCDLPEQPLPAEVSTPASPRHGVSRYLRTGLLTAAAIAVCAVAITVLVGGFGSKKGPATVASVSPLSQPGRADPVADGSDPGRAGCGTDAVSMAMARVHFPADQLSGDIELRYSPHCHAAWGRFEPADGWNPGPGTMVTVWTIRPADQATQSYSVEFGGETIIGNMLMTARGCVAAEVTMARGSVRSPVAATTCMVMH